MEWLNKAFRIKSGVFSFGDVKTTVYTLKNGIIVSVFCQKGTETIEKITASKGEKVFCEKIYDKGESNDSEVSFGDVVWQFCLLISKINKQDSPGAFSVFQKNENTEKLNLNEIARKERLSTDYLSLSSSMNYKILGLFDLVSVEQMNEILGRYPGLIPLRLTKTKEEGKNYFERVGDLFDEDDCYFVVKDRKEYKEKLNEFIHKKNYSSVSDVDWDLSPLIDVERALWNKNDADFVVYNNGHVFSFDEGTFCCSQVALVDIEEYREYERKRQYDWNMMGEDADAHSCEANVGEVGDKFGTLCCAVCGKMWDVPEVDC